MKRKIIIILAGLMIFSASAYALVPLLIAARVAQTIGGVIQSRAVTMGFSALDPRVINTVQSVVGAAGGIAIAYGVANSPTWMHLVDSVLGGSDSSDRDLSEDGSIAAKFNGNGTVTSTASTSSYPPSTTSTFSRLVMSSYGYDNVICGSEEQCLNWYNSVIMPIVFPPETWGVVTRTLTDCSNSWTGSDGAYIRRCRIQYESPIIETYNNAPGHSIPSSMVCPAGQVYAKGVCTSSGLPDPKPPASSTKSIPDAIADIPESEADKPVNHALIADLINQLHKMAALSPSYSNALPYDVTRPVTAADVGAYAAANPSAYPTVRDLASPAVTPTSASIPVSVPGAGVDAYGNAIPGAATAPAGVVNVNLGVDPLLPPPNLAATPTGVQIMQPVTDGMAGWSKFAVPAHVSTCPTSSFEWWGRVHRFDAHCQLVSDNKSLIYGAMLALWVLSAVFIVLRA